MLLTVCVRTHYQVTQVLGLLGNRLQAKIRGLAALDDDFKLSSLDDHVYETGVRKWVTLVGFWFR